MKALVTRDEAWQMASVPQADHQINRLEMECDEMCLRILARRQPVASGPALHRHRAQAGHRSRAHRRLTVNICERVLELNKSLRSEAKVRRAVSHGRGGAEAWCATRWTPSCRATSSARAKLIVERDNVVDARLRATSSRAAHLHDGETRATSIGPPAWQSIAKYLERRGRSATNLAEMIVSAEWQKTSATRSAGEV